METTDGSTGTGSRPAGAKAHVGMGCGDSGSTGTSHAGGRGRQSLCAGDPRSGTEGALEEEGQQGKQPERRPRTQEDKEEAGRSCSQDCETCHPEAALPGRGLASGPREGTARLTLVGAACSHCGPAACAFLAQGAWPPGLSRPTWGTLSLASWPMAAGSSMRQKLLPPGTRQWSVHRSPAPPSYCPVADS